MAAARFRVRPESAALLIIDFQERLVAAMPEAERIACERNITMLVELARRQRWPIVVTQQYTKGLGPMVAALETALQGPGIIAHHLEKMHFAATDDEGFAAVLEAAARSEWIVTGMETHVCVFQTVRGLLERSGVESVHVPVDAVVSRRLANRDRGLAMLESMGAFLTTTESVIFDALGVAGTEDFKAMSRLIR